MILLLLHQNRTYAEIQERLDCVMNPPQNAVVLCVDEKTQIQALDRLQPNLPLKPGLPERRTFEYKRHGITNLFAAFNTANGEFVGQTKQSRNQHDFIDFLDLLARKHGKRREIHVILDNLSIHKTPKVGDWLAAHPNWHFHQLVAQPGRDLVFSGQPPMHPARRLSLGSPFDHGDQSIH